jgi:hypothetical protein
MKRVIFFLSLAVVVAGLSGCQSDCGQSSCRGGGRCVGGPGGPGGSDVAQGPATAAAAYPYYTVRGPRDFLDKNPESIGP